jgi:hypothetical protein
LKRASERRLFFYGKRDKDTFSPVFWQGKSLDNPRVILRLSQGYLGLWQAGKLADYPDSNYLKVNIGGE